MNSKRSNRGYAMDGFVRRPRPGARRRPSIDTLKNSPRRSKADGFVPTADPVEAAGINDEWSLTDENTLTIETDGSDLDYGGTSKREKKAKKGNKPHFWQFKKRREYNNANQSRRRRIIKRILLILGLILLLLGIFMTWKVLRNTSKIFNGNVLGFFDTTKLKGEDQGRVNILLAGTSEDDPDHGGADLTDSIMLTSIDTKNNTGFTVSIPRDLWVAYGETCSAGYQGKVNVAYQCGKDVEFKEAGYAEGGMGLLQKIVSQNLGLPIHYYGKINYTAFKDAVDAVGGIQITVNSDDPRGVYDPNIQKKDGGPLKLANGVQKLDGKTALALARSRNSAGGYGMTRGDFDRTTYQRAMLLALKDKALSAGVISNPAKLGDLLDAAGDNVDTDFKTNELRRLYEISKKINNSKVQSIDLASDEVGLLKTGAYNGQSIVLPTAGLNNFTKIKQYFKKLTSTDPVAREGATVAVLNGSGVVGLAQKRADELTVRGLTVSTVSNASKQRPTNVIVDLTKGKKNSTKTLLEKQFGVAATTDTTANPEALVYQSDFVVIIGQQGSSGTAL
jgi:polyisoprenyl-teichoic acid--peptidoglycan teichoic acid transferase